MLRHLFFVLMFKSTKHLTHLIISVLLHRSSVCVISVRSSQKSVHLKNNNLWALRPACWQCLIPEAHTAVAVSLSSRRLYPFSHRVHAKCTVLGLKTATTTGHYRPMSRLITHTMSTEQPVVFRCLAFIGLLSLSCRLLSSPLLCPFACFYITGRLDLRVMGR